MSITKEIAKHIREIHFGGNWTASNLREHLSDLDWQQANTQIANFNTIGTLTFHMNYYVGPVIKVLQGGPLEAKDALSFDHPPIRNQSDWEQLLQKCWKEAELLAQLIEALPDSILKEHFFEEKHGSYYRNLHGIIEHNNYHLGQIVILKKLLLNGHEN